MSSNLDNPDTDSVVEGHEPKSANIDGNRTEEEGNRTDDVDEGVDLQGKKHNREWEGKSSRFLELLPLFTVNFLQ